MLRLRSVCGMIQAVCNISNSLMIHDNVIIHLLVSCKLLRLYLLEACTRKSLAGLWKLAGCKGCKHVDSCCLKGGDVSFSFSRLE